MVRSSIDLGRVCFAVMNEAVPTILLADDHDLFRAGLRKLLEGEQLRVVADCRANAGMLDMVRRTKPTVVMLDIATADGSDTSLLAQLTTEFPDVNAMVFTRAASDVDIHQALRAGARGYVMKETAIGDLAGAIRSIARGNAIMSPQVATTVVEMIRTGTVPRTSHGGMSERELDVLRLLAQGYDNNQIAEELGISAKTVKNHVSSIFMKLDMTNRVQAAVYAVRSGLA